MFAISARFLFVLVLLWPIPGVAHDVTMPTLAPLVIRQAVGTDEDVADEPPEKPPEKPPEVVPAELKSARRTMKTFLTAVENNDFVSALATLDKSQVPDDMDRFEMIAPMQHLKGVIERLAVVDYGLISDDPDGPTFRFPPGQINQPIVIARSEEGVWRFSAETLAMADRLYETVRHLPVAARPTVWYHRELIMGNEVWRVLTLAGGILFGLLLGQLVRFIMSKVGKYFERRKRPIVAITCVTVGRFSVPALFLAGLGGGIEALVLDHSVQSLTMTIVRVMFTLVIAYAAYRLVDVVVEFIREMTRRAGGSLNDMVVPVVSTSLRMTVFVLAFLEIATYLSDKPPSSVIAGLGIGGLAIGLGAQDTLKNFFGSVAIFLDRPFELGDRIQVDGHDGPVEVVGFRSSKIRTLDGHLVTIPNGELAHKTIQNIGKRPFIRRVMDVRIAYDTPSEKVERALAILRELVDEHEGRKPEFPPRVFLSDFLEAAVNIRVIYWYHPPAYWDYVEFGERFNLEIMKRFEVEGIRFALPAQTVFVAGDADRPLSGADRFDQRGEEGA